MAIIQSRVPQGNAMGDAFSGIADMLLAAYSGYQGKKQAKDFNKGVNEEYMGGTITPGAPVATPPPAPPLGAFATPTVPDLGPGGNPSKFTPPAAGQWNPSQNMSLADILRQFGVM